MIVHFAASTKNLEKRINFYNIITDTVLKNGAELALYWIDREFRFIRNGINHTKADWQTIADDNISAITKSDVLIVDVSEHSFAVGFQVATAINQKKPVLMLVGSDSKGGSFASGIKSDFVKVKKYQNEFEVGLIAKDFLVENSIENKDLRFNFFIDKKIYNYLRWTSYKSHKSKSEILRELVNREIDKNN